jgi:hypothetical protein
MFHGLVPLLLVLAVIVTAGAARAADLSPQELRGALAAIQSSTASAKAAAPGRTDPRLYVASATKYRERGNGGAAREIVEVLFYRYEDGVTVRVSLDPASGQILETQEHKAFPTPLADEEYQEAVRLAKEGSEAVRTFLAARKAGDVAISAVPPVISDPNDARYGHRIVLLRFAPKTERGPVVVVELDLTRKSVKPFEG